MTSKNKTGFNIRKKILLILYAVLSVTIIGNFVIGGRIAERAQVTAFDNEAFATARGLQGNINSLIEKSFLPYTEIVNCETLLDGFVRNNVDVLYTYTTDADGTILYTSADAVTDGISTERLAQSVLSGAEENIEDDENEVLYYLLPLVETEKVDGEEVTTQVGVLVVAYPRTRITEQLNRFYMANALLAVVTLTCSVLLIILFLGKWVTKPLQKLDAAIRKVSEKGLVEAHSLDIQTDDEIGQIAQSFNDMVVQLEDTTVSKNYIDSVLVNMSEALFVIDKNKNIEKVNDAALSLLGYDREELQGQSVDMLYSDVDDSPFINEDFDDEITSGRFTNDETEFVGKEGNNIAVSVNWSTIKDDAGDVSKYVCTARDVTDLKKARNMMMYQANCDQLTGLFNRYYLDQSMEYLLKDTDRNNVFVVVDLDKFKMVNDVCGHAAGDELLKQIAYMLKLAAGENNVVARLGGDEFAIIMYDTDIKQMTEAMEGLLKDIRNFTFTWEGKAFNVGMSIGAVETNNPALISTNVFVAADRACYIAKQKGGNRLQIYTGEDKELTEREEEAFMMPVITEAFENNRFFLVYQPIISLTDNDDIHMYEVLVRLRTKEGAILKPGAFLSSAERYNMLLLLDKWVIHNFCENYHENIEKLCGEGPVQFNINLTNEALKAEEFFDFVKQEFEKYNIPSDVMCFEVEESQVVSNLMDATTLMKRFGELGCKFAIDHFGIGMSSFMYLKLLPVDTVKIYGGVISEMCKSPVDMTVAKSVNEIAHLLNIKTVAEWVENNEILEKVKELGIDYAQGYGIVKPGRLEDIVG